MFCKKIKRSIVQTRTWIVLVKFGWDGCTKFKNLRKKVSLSQVFEERESRGGNNALKCLREIRNRQNYAEKRRILF
jgi:hypothetical protein